jgi:hypothetical protein
MPGNYAEAARLFEKTHRESSNSEALFGLGLARYRLKQVDSAVIVGIEIGRANFRWEVTSLALSIARWVHSSTMAAFPEAPL